MTAQVEVTKEAIKETPITLSKLCENLPMS